MPPDACIAAQGKGAEEQREPSQLDLLLARLPGCVSKELADELAVNFCYQQTKSARRRLARALAAELPLGALALLPYYARITATLAQVFPDIAQGGGCGRRRGLGGGEAALVRHACLRQGLIGRRWPAAVLVRSAFLGTPWS